MSELRVPADGDDLELALHESESKYRDLFTNLIDGVALHEIVLDEDGIPVDYVFLEVNTAFEQLLGLKASEVVGRRVTQVLPGIENDPADWIGRYGRVALTGEAIRFEQHSEPLDRWYAVSAYRSGPLRFVTVFDDITDRKRSEAELREVQDSLAAAFADLNRAQSVAHVGSWRLYSRAGELAWSDETCRIFGVAPGTPMTYELFISRIHPEDRARVDSAWNAALSGTPYSIEHRIVVGEDVRWVHEQAELEFDESGELLGGFGTVQDVTERRLAEDRTRREHRAVSVSNRILELFVSEAGDDLYEKALGVLLDETGSAQGVFGYIDEGGELICPTMSRMTDECEMGDTCIRYKQDGWKGLWGRTMREQKPRFSNDAVAVPKGHVAISNNLAVPIVFHGVPIGLFNVANKQGGYTEDDLALLDSVARLIAPVLYAWIQRELRRDERSRADQQREAYLSRLVDLLAVSADVLAASAVEEMLQRVSDAARDLIGARLVVAGHGFQGGVFRVGVDSRATGAPPCPPGEAFVVERGGVYQELFGQQASIRLTQEELLAHPLWWGLPEGHIELRGLLGAALPDPSGEALGMLMLSDKQGGGEFTEEDEILLRQLASLASLGLQKTELYERERAISETLQEAILTDPEPIDGVAVSFLYRPASSTARVGGDFYDVFRIDDDRMVIVIGDVAGKGIEAARLTSLVRDGIRAYAYEDGDPAALLTRLNRLVHRCSAVESFATVFLGVLDRHTGRLDYSVAAHPHGVLFAEDRTEFLACSPTGPVGAFEGMRYVMGRTTMRRGDRLVLYTDGITEARREREMFGEHRLKEALARLAEAPVEQVPERLLAEVVTFAEGRLHDDTVVMCVEWRGCADE